jgi:hypothetical protein
MTSGSLKVEIDAFRREVGEPVGILAEAFTPQDVIDRVQRIYLPQAIQRDEATKREVLQALRAGWLDNQDHGQIRRWGRAAVNLAVFVLGPSSPNELDEKDLSKAIDAIVRFSGWYHTESNIWKRFQPYAERVVKELWGDIEQM